MNSLYIETVKLLDGEIFNIHYHQERYKSVLETLNSKNVKSLRDYINPPPKGLFRCRVLYSVDDVVSVSYHEYKKREINSLKLIESNETVYNKKSANREELNRLYLKRELCDDVLIIKNSLITDTTIANVALYRDGVWHTPKSPLLKGTSRARLLDEKRIVEKDIYLKDIYSYEKIALLNAMIDFDIIQEKNIRSVIC